MNKKVYLALSADILHHGHMNIIEKASMLGDLTVGVLTDEVIASYKYTPLLDTSERVKIVSGIKYIKEVIIQKELDYEENLRKLRPDYVVHGDEWREGILKNIRSKVINILSEWGGELIEYPYVKDINIEKIRNELAAKTMLPEIRRPKLQQLLNTKQIVRIMEVHNGLTGLIVENAKVVKENKIETFDGMWLSSLTDSTAKGKPDIELVDLTSRISTINDVIEVTTKPIILDADTGGLTEHFVFNIKTLERLGVSAVIIEDKIGLKKNSLFGVEVDQTQDTIENFCDKIRRGKNSLISKDFMIIARIESLILNKGIDDAIKRAKAYIEAGASGIMIHSRKKTPDEIFEFCDKYSDFGSNIPLVVVPTTFNTVYEKEFYNKGVRIVIYANQLVRSAFPAMMKTACTILEHNRVLEADEYCMPIKEILNLIPGGN